MKHPTPTLPDDFYSAATDPAIAWQELERQGGEARLKRMDIAYGLHLEEIKRGEQGWIERVAQALNLDTEQKSSKVVISDAVSIFKTFRLTGEEGLGYTRQDLSTISNSKLRAVAQHRKWALENRDQVKKLLNDPKMGEDKIRAAIREAKGESATKKSAPSGFEDFTVRLTTQDAQYVRDVLHAMELIREGENFSEHEGVKAGQLLKAVLAEWVLGSQVYGEEEILNAQFMPGGEFHDAEDAENTQQQAAD